ncbi:MAG: diaminopimelate epimerase [Tindallia sp. MSAO_Bac2]|nr:MAG: diaminopimelate epimerase [Tindallia sp. MSAO_Bac2]
MKLKFYKCSPAENMTVLVWDPVEREQYAEVANEIMEERHLHAEQVGFVTPPVRKSAEIAARLEMMGGEFCANATLSLATVISFREDIQEKSEGRKKLKLESSGVKDAMTCFVDKGESPYSRRVSLQIGLPQAVSDVQIVSEEKSVAGMLVELPGIAHLIVDRGNVENPESFFEDALKQLEEKKFDALGIMFFDERKMHLEPLVWVRATNSLFWEKGCGSGTAALGIAKASKEKESVDLNINQPGGVLGISVKWQGKAVKEAWLSGDVKIVAEGFTYL